LFICIYECLCICICLCISVCMITCICICEHVLCICRGICILLLIAGASIHLWPITCNSGYLISRYMTTWFVKVKV
jgi:hypothetical protein